MRPTTVCGTCSWITYVLYSENVGSGKIGGGGNIMSREMYNKFLSKLIESECVWVWSEKWVDLKEFNNEILLCSKMRQKTTNRWDLKATLKKIIHPELYAEAKMVLHWFDVTAKMKRSEWQLGEELCSDRLCAIFLLVPRYLSLQARNIWNCTAGWICVWCLLPICGLIRTGKRGVSYYSPSLSQCTAFPHAVNLEKGVSLIPPPQFGQIKLSWVQFCPVQQRRRGPTQELPMSCFKHRPPPNHQVFETMKYPHSCAYPPRRMTPKQRHKMGPKCRLWEGGFASKWKWGVGWGKNPIMGGGL